MNEHEHVQELLAVRALGGLDPEGMAELDRVLAEHGECAECAESAAGFDETAGHLAFSLAPVTPSLTAADVLAAARAAPRPTGTVVKLPAPRRRWTGSLLVAAAVSLLVVGAVGGILIAHQGTDQSAALARYLTGSQTQIHTFKGTGGVLSAATQPGSARSYVFGNLEGLPSDKVYQLWLLHGSTPVAGPTFLPDGTTVVLPVDASLTGANALAITVEPTGGSPQPTTTPLLVASIST